MAKPVVVRFAPSPTGPPHLGSLRTALFDWLFARATGGRFIIRIEDTDRTRYTPESETQMLKALEWFGLDWDEGPTMGGPHAPYRQSERLDRYHEAANKLLENGYAYRPKDEPEIIRLHTPKSGQVSFHDLVRGKISFDYTEVPQNPVLMKSDGYPTYHLAAMVDDIEMGISHILRGEEWIPSTPIHLRVFEGLGAEPPEFIHLPLVIDMDGKKLKKRDPSYEVSTFQKAGHIPAAMMNYLALLGWNPGTTKEIYTPQDLIADFTIERLSPSASAFDPDRLRWFGRQHMDSLPDPDLLNGTLPYLHQAYPDAARADGSWLMGLVNLVRDELAVFGDATESARFAFEKVALSDEADESLKSAPALPVLDALFEALTTADPLDSETSKSLLRDIRKQFKKSDGWGGRAVMFPIRAALTGTVHGPHLSEIVVLLGNETCRSRIKETLAIIR